MDDTNDSGSHALRVLDVMNNSRHQMISTSIGHDLKASDAMNTLGMWMT